MRTEREFLSVYNICFGNCVGDLRVLLSLHCRDCLFGSVHVHGSRKKKVRMKKAAR